MNTIKLFFSKATYIFVVLFFVISCEKDNNSSISGVMTSGTEDILQGDVALVTIKFDGGEPPFAFRYYFYGVSPTTGVYGKQNNYILDIQDREYTFGLFPKDTITYYAQSVAAFYDNVGPAVGEITFNVTPVNYIEGETIGATKTGFIQKSINSLNFSTGQLALKKDATDFARTVYFEFDVSEFKNVEEKSKYMLRFWLISSHSSGVNKDSRMEVSGKVGGLDDNMSWDTQPDESDMIQLFSENFKPPSESERIEFYGDITSVVTSALDDEDTKKITIRLLENVNNTGNGGMFYIGGNLAGENLRPSLDMQYRRPATN